MKKQIFLIKLVAFLYFTTLKPQVQMHETDVLVQHTLAVCKAVFSSMGLPLVSLLPIS
jgi:hypothetical protein